MTIASGFAQRSRQPAAVTASLDEVPEPVTERVGIDSIEVAHGGHRRSVPAPSPPALPTPRVPQPIFLHTQIRRVSIGRP